MHHFDTAGVAVYALSYDEADALQDFRDAHGITYHLLSDPDSQVIRNFGILNTLISEDDHPWYGIPYPGTYVMNKDGVITHKFFDSNLAVRAGPEQLLRAAQGHSVEPKSAATGLPEDVELEVTLDGDALASTVQRDLVIRLNVPDGRHVYAFPAPQGSVAVDVQLDANERLVQRPIRHPASEPHTLTGTTETFQVHHGVCELRIPLTVNNASAQDYSEIEVSGIVRWQTCDDEICDIPSSQQFALNVAVAKPPTVALSPKGAELEPNAMAHFQKMSTRRTGSN